MERAAAALLAVDPAAERFEDEDHIELNLDAMQISVYARSAAITVPYWFEGADAERVMARAFEYARVLAETCGYTVWDPQTESVVEDGSDAAAAGSIMSQISGQLDEFAARRSVRGGRSGVDGGCDHQRHPSPARRARPAAGLRGAPAAGRRDPARRRPDRAVGAGRARGARPAGPRRARERRLGRAAGAAAADPDRRARATPASPWSTTAAPRRAGSSGCGAASRTPTPSSSATRTCRCTRSATASRSSTRVADRAPPRAEPHDGHRHHRRRPARVPARRARLRGWRRGPAVVRRGPRACAGGRRRPAAHPQPRRLALERQPRLVAERHGHPRAAAGDLHPHDHAAGPRDPARAAAAAPAPCPCGRT